MKTFFFKIKRAISQWKTLKKMPLRLEFVVTDYCNLNCRGCTHYSPLAPKEFIESTMLFSQMEHLGKTCGDKVEQVYLIGGETLLYPHLTSAMAALRKAFPKQIIKIFTNGLILKKMSDEFWEAVKQNDVEIVITRYPINFDYDAAEELCHQKGVKLSTFADRSISDSFFRFPLDLSKRQNKYLSHFRCYNRGCVSVVDGFIYPCSISACVKHLNKAGGFNFEHKAGDRIAVEDIQSARQILKLRDNPVPFCSYCKKVTIRPYDSSKREMTEWVDQ